MSEILDSHVAVILAAAVLVSCLAWPIAWYHVSVCEQQAIITKAAITAGLVGKSNDINTYWTKP